MPPVSFSRYGVLKFHQEKSPLCGIQKAARIEKNITEVFAFLQVVGRDKEGGMQSRTFSLNRTGLTRGWESIDREYFTAQSERIVRELNELLVAENCPKMIGSVSP